MESHFKKFIWMLIAVGLGSFLGSTAQAADNLLIGMWKWDNNRTLREVRLPTEGSEQLVSDAARAKRFVEGQASNLRSKMTLTFTNKECTEVIVDGSGAVISKKTFPYKILEAGRDYVIVDQMEDGGAGRLFFVWNGFYVEVKVGEFTYRDYFTRT